MKNGIKKFFKKRKQGIFINFSIIEDDDNKSLGYVNVQTVPRVGESITLHTLEGMLFGEVIEVYHDMTTDYECKELGKVRHEATQQSITVFLKIIERN